MIRAFKAPFKNRFFHSRYPYSQSGALAIYDCMRPALRKGYLVRKKRFLKGTLKGCLRRVSYQMTPAYVMESTDILGQLLIR